jgi:16S rRNA (uracil1498-N3)-methyltransferase
VADEIVLPDAAARHLAQVLRLAPGSEVTLFNGRGGEYHARLAAVGRRRVVARIEAFDPREAEPPQQVTLAQAVSRGDRMDMTVQKAVELGVTRIEPLVTVRAAPLPTGDRLEKRLDHWRGVVASACEQCGRNRLPEVAPPVALDAWLGTLSADLRLLLAPGGPARVATLPRPGSARVVLAVGPEGGFDEHELATFAEAGFLAIDLGPRILRTETAALVALAQIQGAWWDGR